MSGFSTPHGMCSSLHVMNHIKYNRLSRNKFASVESLTCVLSKVMERIITSKIFDHLQLNNVLNKSQHGFIRRRSTCTNVLECVNDWTFAFSHSSRLLSYIVVLVKLSMLCCTKKPILKALHVCIHGALLTWLQNFFTRCTHCTKLGGHVSDIAQLISGVVHESSIGQLVFQIYVNELTDILEKLGVNVKMFADDAKMYLQITDDTDVAHLYHQAGCRCFNQLG